MSTLNALNYIDGQWQGAAGGATGESRNPADGSVIGSVLSPSIDSHDGIWTNFSSVYAVPVSAFSVDYTMHFVRNFGRDLDAFFDDNELAMVPEPASIAMLGLGALALAGVRRRRRRG